MGGKGEGFHNITSTEEKASAEERQAENRGDDREGEEEKKRTISSGTLLLWGTEKRIETKSRNRQRGGAVIEN